MTENTQKSVLRGERCFEVTERWIHDHRTAGGGWTKKALAVLGVVWPPEHGWVARSVGKLLTTQQRALFESQGQRRQPKQQHLRDEANA